MHGIRSSCELEHPHRGGEAERRPRIIADEQNPVDRDPVFTHSHYARSFLAKHTRVAPIIMAQASNRSIERDRSSPAPGSRPAAHIIAYANIRARAREQLTTYIMARPQQQQPQQQDAAAFFTAENVSVSTSRTVLEATER